MNAKKTAPAIGLIKKITIPTIHQKKKMNTNNANSDIKTAKEIFQYWIDIKAKITAKTMYSPHP